MVHGTILHYSDYSAFKAELFAELYHVKLNTSAPLICKVWRPKFCLFRSVYLTVKSVNCLWSQNYRSLWLTIQALEALRGARGFWFIILWHIKTSEASEFVCCSPARPKLWHWRRPSAWAGIHWLTVWIYDLVVDSKHWDQIATTLGTLTSWSE